MNLDVINQVTSLVLMMAVGVFLRKKQILNDAMMKAFTDLLLTITLPFMIIYSFNIKFSQEILNNGVTMFVSSLLIHVFLILLSQLFYLKADITKRYILHFSTVFSNCGFIGFPLMYSLYGQIGVFYTSIFVACYNLFAFSYGVMLFTGKSKITSMIKSMLLNLPLLTTVVGLFIFLFSIQLPKGALLTLQSVGNMTTPISMFIIGAMLADVSIKEAIKGLDVLYLSLVKLILAPIFCYLLLSLFIDNITVLTIAVILVAMPSGSMCGVFAEKYDGNRSLASRCTFLTTILSVITIPIVISVLGNLTHP